MIKTTVFLRPIYSIHPYIFSVHVSLYPSTRLSNDFFICLYQPIDQFINLYLSNYQSIHRSFPCLTFLLILSIHPFHMYPFIDLHILFLYICIYFDNVFLLIDMYIICTSYMYIYLSLPVTQDISIILFLFFFLEVYLYRRDLAEAVTFTGNLSFKDELILGLALDIIFRFIYQSIIKIISTSRFKSEPNSVPKFRQGPFIVSWRGPSYN